ncbi:DUF1361 domain-containing protein [Chryseobacterium indologenes]|uniref:DUF1361 domain-containing protein n=1 Tax=Chryseobacterium indologenes TaxID=253 RepID=UPI000F5153DF|nr:DUF1361 domain-containing protein [Chryseobacterium indologenes]AYZ37242.1 DUF1361 domain-containing protein [Chryseobacterium indologenes]MBF6646099.1 DUF1361 domain-containing protein [Chryseobacterium indologenes]MBU3049141.1 DUF1361 domain-containing protein [Chryseobacterium indologenes]MEB4762605.1 DUF1361 domain-containing protein [Chryseobacterium indologenes]QQQ70225.1 DUF1361 domain-containing protein [Chryseobacterium indologenes]
MNKIMKSSRFTMNILLVFMTLFCFSLSIFRYYVSETKVFFFLNWNLFLAWIPFLLSSFIGAFKIKSKTSLVLIIIVWILFFPNSPYILTDLFHLKMRDSIPVWYDLIVILSYAWTGLICGFISLHDIEKLLSENGKKRMVTGIVVLFLFMSSFGVYLGRFLRWNSWDVFNDPSGLLGDIIIRFINPTEYSGTWGLTFLMGIMLNCMYFTFKLMESNEKTVIEAEK